MGIGRALDKVGDVIIHPTILKCVAIGGTLVAGLGLGGAIAQGEFTGQRNALCAHTTIKEIGHFSLTQAQIDGAESKVQADGRHIAGLPTELTGILGGKGLKLVDVTAHLEPFNGDPMSAERNARLIGEAADLEGQLGELVPRSNFAHIGIHETYKSDMSNAPITVAVSQPTC